MTENVVRGLLAVAICALVIGAGVFASHALRLFLADPTGEEYVAYHEQGARLVPAGKLHFDGESFTCAHIPRCSMTPSATMAPPIPA